ncbi:flagellar basal body rod protein FlgB [Buchnera aphidicola]|uniref:Flagellar basal body rod protein FlgB n=1 Tax=Buchnera aphidicola (Artemisaphis artemisicola) TaxID=1241836 RepID=A0A4D6XF44_9GAMM|nr:flagellar basal body rod protein FlgB [Buchnera aphidicola]QCI16006.1 flagellar basal body rod protein FlgB [Buchnera aphidicola (Artemisaphis artemisicola)]
MFDKINKIFDFSQNKLNLYAKRQEILSSNIANADTPGYKARDVDFKNEFNKILNQKDNSIPLKKTSFKHLNGKNNFILIKTIPIDKNQIKLDGNTVNMDRERIAFMDNSLKYQSILVYMKNEIKNIMRILKG